MQDEFWNKYINILSPWRRRQNELSFKNLVGKFNSVCMDFDHSLKNAYSFLFKYFILSRRHTHFEHWGSCSAWNVTGDISNDSFPLNCLKNSSTSDITIVALVLTWCLSMTSTVCRWDLNIALPSFFRLFLIYGKFILWNLNQVYWFLLMQSVIFNYSIIIFFLNFCIIWLFHLFC